MQIRKVTEADFNKIWPIFRAVIATGDTYVFSPSTSIDDAHAYWLGEGVTSYVVEENDLILGFYKLIPNQRDLGSHVANASFMVNPDVRGKGIGQAMGQHCLTEAKKLGYLAVQFNFVISTNKNAIALWEKLGFVIVGTLPKAFRHQQLGLVDAYVMHRFLDDIVI